MEFSKYEEHSGKNLDVEMNKRDYLVKMNSR